MTTDVIQGKVGKVTGKHYKPTAPSLTEVRYTQHVSRHGNLLHNIIQRYFFREETISEDHFTNRIATD